MCGKKKLMIAASLLINYTEGEGIFSESVMYAVVHAEKVLQSLARLSDSISHHNQTRAKSI